MNVDTTHLAVIFGMALALCVLSTPLLRTVCRRTRLFPQNTPPRLGGLAIAFAAVIPLAFWLSQGHAGLETDTQWLQLLGLSAALVTILALGVYDDIRGTTPWEKLAVQCLLALATWIMGFRIDVLATPWSDTIELSTWASIAMTTGWIVGITNAVNLIDGLDGLAAGVSLIAVATLLTFGVADGDVLLSVTCAALAGALVGFLFFNFNPATIFMGDCGSLFLGFVLALVGMESTNKQVTAWALIIPALALGLPIFDMVFAVIRRVWRGRPVTERDTDHVHHQLMRAGYTHRQAVLVLYGCCLVLAGAAWVLKATRNPSQALLLAGVCAAVFAVIHVLGLPGTIRAQHRRNKAIQGPNSEFRRGLRLLTRDIRKCADLDELWHHSIAALKWVGASHVLLELYTNERHRWRHAECPLNARTHTEIRTTLSDTSHQYGRLDVAFARPSRFEVTLDRDHELSVHLIAEAVTDGLENLMTLGLKQRLVVSQLPVK